jgi:hypothetical protein
MHATAAINTPARIECMGYFILSEFAGDYRRIRDKKL